MTGDNRNVISNSVQLRCMQTWIHDMPGRTAFIVNLHSRLSLGFF